MRIDLNELIESAHTLTSQLASFSPRINSVEWYALNNTIDFESSLRMARNNDDIERAANALSRFAVDSLEWGSVLMKNLECLADRAHRLAKENY